MVTDLAVGQSEHRELTRVRCVFCALAQADRQATDAGFLLEFCLMTRQLKARPTEYKGVVYRSKSEAMFARWLELEVADRELAGFYYEPKEFEVDGWVPDFVCWKVEKRDNQLSIGRVFIEYKPAIPTSTYIKELAAKTHKLAKVAQDPPMFTNVCVVLACGGFFNQPQKWLIAQWAGDNETRFINRQESWLTNARRELIRSTRFDLEFRYGG
jgi:hypothetical protein